MGRTDPERIVHRRRPALARTGQSPAEITFGHHRVNVSLEASERLLAEGNVEQARRVLRATLLASKLSDEAKADVYACLAQVELDSPPLMLPSGWAAFLYLYDLR